LTAQLEMGQKKHQYFDAGDCLQRDCDSGLLDFVEQKRQL
jgi:hypothetical protein